MGKRNLKSTHYHEVIDGDRMEMNQSGEICLKAQTQISSKTVSQLKNEPKSHNVQYIYVSYTFQPPPTMSE